MKTKNEITMALSCMLLCLFLQSCGGGGGSAPASTVPAYSVSASPSGNGSPYVANRSETAPSSYSVSGIPAPTADEIADLQDVDTLMVLSAGRVTGRKTYATSSRHCTPTASSSYAPFLQLAIDFYNAYRNDTTWPTGTNNLEAAFRSSSDQQTFDKFNVFECSEEEINASAGFRNITINDGLIKVLDETTDLLFFVDSAGEYEYYLKAILANANAGRHFQVVTPAMHNLLATDQTYGPASALLFAETLAYVTGHELGHLSMSHSIQKLRNAKNGGTTYDQAVLSWGHELQADIFSTTFFKLDEESTVGAELVLYILELYSSGNFSLTHPPSDYRRYIVSHVDSGDIVASSALEPIYIYARPTPPRQASMQWAGFMVLRKNEMLSQ